MRNIFLQMPSNQVIRAFIESQQRCDYTYPSPGCTVNGSIDGYICDQYRVKLGIGKAAFTLARQAIAAWAMFPREWTRVVHGDTPIHAEQTVAVLIRVFGLWFLNSARIVYVIDESDFRFGFAYGTLPGHVESGEERFLVERDENDVVWYDLRAISRPRHWITRLGHPFVRRQQRRFAHSSQRAMIEALDRFQQPDASQSEISHLKSHI